MTILIIKISNISNELNFYNKILILDKIIIQTIFIYLNKTNILKLNNIYFELKIFKKVIFKIK